VTLDIVFITGFHGCLTWVYFLIFTGFSMNTLVGIAIAFPFAGRLFSESFQLKHSLIVMNREKGKEEEWIRRFARAFSPLRVSVGNFATVKKHTGLATLGLILYYTLRITILLKGKLNSLIFTCS
jgi:hypothetical protein